MARNVNIDKYMQDYFEKVADIIISKVRNALARLGEETVAYAKDRGPEESWIDHTQNLRSSIGYALYEHGNNVITSAFEGAGMKGTSEGKKLINELASEYRDTVISLVVVAAMDYAEYVEAIDGKDVLASAEIKAKRKVDETINRAIQQAEKEIEKIPFDVTITI